MGFIKFFAFLIGSREEVPYGDEDYTEYDEYDEYDDDITYISNDGLDGGEVITEPRYV